MLKVHIPVSVPQTGLRAMRSPSRRSALWRDISYSIEDLTALKELRFLISTFSPNFTSPLGRRENIHIAPEASLLHVAVGAQSRYFIIIFNFWNSCTPPGGGYLRFGNDLKEGNAGPVKLTYETRLPDRSSEWTCRRPPPGAPSDADPFHPSPLLTSIWPPLQMGLSNWEI
jgi:hypothetical protein